MISLLNFLNGKASFLRSRINYWLSISVIFSIGLVVATSVIGRTFPLLFLIWNLFLGFIPFAITNWLQSYRHKIKNKAVISVLVLVWLLFIPNSFYILTDLFHLGSFQSMPLWLELAVIFSFAWNGLLMGVLSVRKMEFLFSSIFFKPAPVLFIYPVMFFVAMGVYIGRYMRFNSWDVVTNPFNLMRDISELAFHPFQYSQAWAMIICFSVFLTLIFFTLMSANGGRELTQMEGTN